MTRFLTSSLTTLALLLCIVIPDTKAESVPQRLWWVYLSPAEAAQLYHSESFAFIQKETDQILRSGVKSRREALKSGTGYVIEMGRSLELLSATYAALKWGRYQGKNDPSLTPHLDRIVEFWKDVLATGPAAYWTDSFPTRTPVAIDKTTGWREGDIALRSWIPGAWPSYDAVRDDLKPEDRRVIDEWMSQLAEKMWADQDFSLEHNRGASRYAQAHIIALLLQDKGRVESYWNDPKRGLSHALGNFDNHTKPEFNFPYRPGLSKEHSYKTGPYGRGSMMHTFGGLMTMTHAARNGGDPAWDAAAPTNQPFLNSMLDTWYDYGTGSRTAYIEFCNALEMNWAKHKQTTDESLSASLWMSFAFLQTRFTKLNYWKAADGQAVEAVVALWKERALMLSKPGLPAKLE
jgi:hypothetical protein